MWAVFAIVLLPLMSLSHSTPQACNHLVQPLNQVDLHHLEGKRAMVAGSLSHLPFIERLRLRESATAKFSSTINESISFSRSSRSDNNCRYASYNISLEGSSFTFDNGRVNTTFIHTSCHDCVLLSFNVHSEKRQHVYLFSRRRQLEEREIEEFRAQVECFNLPTPVVMDPRKELCPDPSATEERTGTEQRKGWQRTQQTTLISSYLIASCVNKSETRNMLEPQPSFIILYNFHIFVFVLYHMSLNQA